ncbi:uncharacterized protein LOC141901733 [Tubulanus polymorphus]|uniref:uncharacterized protein LOC141901733 n=1 Tax=Tubulanus polymorphus TaxID=672921 RepID=UPI003DA55989
MAAPTANKRKAVIFVSFLAGCLYLGYRIHQYLASRKRQETENENHSETAQQKTTAAAAAATVNGGSQTGEIEKEIKQNQQQQQQQMLNKPVDEKPRVPSPIQNLTTADVWTTIRELDEGGAGSLDVRQAKVLIALLQPNADPDATAKVLNIVANCAAFTSSQNALREAGCLSKLTVLLHSQLMAEEAGYDRSDHLLQSICAAINNLSMNSENQDSLAENIPTLIKLSEKTSNSEIHLSLLQPLTNLCVLQTTHKHYTQYIQHLYELLSSTRPAIVIQALRILVNLSTNSDMVPYLLAAKAPMCFLSLLVMDGNDAVLIRWVTFLTNVVETVRDFNITSFNLPTRFKAASPETTHNQIYGVDGHKLRSKVFVLTQCTHPEIKSFARRIFDCLSLRGDDDNNITKPDEKQPVSENSSDNEINDREDLLIEADTCKVENGEVATNEIDSNTGKQQ